MLTNPSDYKYVTNPPSVNGLIVPTTDGTGGEGVIRLENINYLMEMASERHMLQSSSIKSRELVPSHIYSDFNKNTRTIGLDVLKAIAGVAKDGLVNRHGSFAIDKDWEWDAQARVFDGYTFWRDVIFNGAEVPRASDPSKVGVLTLTDDLRKLYYDFKRMIRFVLPMSGVENGKYSQYHAEDLQCNGFAYGPIVHGDGNTIYNYRRKSASGEWETEDEEHTGFYVPYAEKFWNSDGELSGTCDTVCNHGILFDYARCGGSGRQLFGSDVDLWIVFTGGAEWEDDDGNPHGAPIVVPYPMIANIQPVPNPLRIGSVETGRYFVANYSAFRILEDFIEPAVRSLYPDFNKKPTNIGVRCTDFLVDTRRVTFPSELQSSWEWEPR